MAFKPRICKQCGKQFKPKTYRHVFCNRKCFSQNYRQNIKETKFPSFICPRCKRKSKLNFHPKVNNSKWRKWKCPFCGENTLNNKVLTKKNLKI